LWRHAKRRDLSDGPVRDLPSTHAIEQSTRHYMHESSITHADDPVLAGHRPQSSSASRRTASQTGFFNLSQSGDRPDRYGESFRLRDQFISPPGLPIFKEIDQDAIHRPLSNFSLSKRHAGR
jgi:hypothetical protein